MIQGEIKVRVRYGETDRMGYAYYGCYPLYYEMGRTELLREYGLTYKELEDSGTLLPVSRLEINYIAPALYDEVLTVRTTIRQKPTVKIIFNYEIFNEKNELINTAITELVFVNASTRKPCRPPKYFMERIDQIQWK
ncbi:MAG: acyl-CoA thioesterase [Bacteroidales bacterium]|nr:acyl-CoA thioesterase [Bacteroidales bacterium]